MTERKPCPGCGAILPRAHDEIYAWHARPCCNPACQMQWGIGCWHCHGSKPSPSAIQRAAEAALDGWTKAVIVADDYSLSMDLRGRISFLGGSPSHSWTTLVVWALLPDYPAMWSGTVSIRGAFLAVADGSWGYRGADLDDAISVWCDHAQAHGNPLGAWVMQCLADRRICHSSEWEPAAIWALYRQVTE